MIRVWIRQIRHCLKSGHGLSGIEILEGNDLELVWFNCKKCKTTMVISERRGYVRIRKENDR